MWKNWRIQIKYGPMDRWTDPHSRGQQLKVCCKIRQIDNTNKCRKYGPIMDQSAQQGATIKIMFRANLDKCKRYEHLKTENMCLGFRQLIESTHYFSGQKSWNINKFTRKVRTRSKAGRPHATAPVLSDHSIPWILLSVGCVQARSVRITSLQSSEMR